MLLPLMNENLLSIPTVCASFFRLLLYLSEMAPEAVVEINDRMMTDFLSCTRVALTGEYGTERLSVALEVLSNLANYSVESQKASPFVLDAISSFVQVCKSFSCRSHMLIFSVVSKFLWSSAATWMCSMRPLARCTP